MDIRIVVSTDLPASDVDLIVREPSGEECTSEHPQTTIGALLTCGSASQGSAQEYTLRHKMAGQYQIEVRLVGNPDERTSGPVTATATIYTNFGRPDERREVMSVRLKNGDGLVSMGTLQFK
jgi:uncharacterized protein YfaP (DUF2135 family)